MGSKTAHSVRVLTPTFRLSQRSSLDVASNYRRGLCPLAQPNPAKDHRVVSESQSSAPRDGGGEPLGKYWTGPEWDEEPIRPPLWRRAQLIIILSIVGVFVLGGSVIFLFGEDLFGSDRGTIDSYNREVLNSCELPPESTLVRTYITPVVDRSGQPLRAMTYVHASPLQAPDVAAFYGVQNLGEPTLISADQACRFGNRPSLLVVSLSSQQDGVEDPGIEAKSSVSELSDEFWGGDDTSVTEITEPPSQTLSLFGLRLAQPEVEGIFD